MSKLREWSYSASQRVMVGLAQELSIRPNYHYQPRGFNASRVLSLRLVGVNPAYLPKIKGLQNQLAFWAGLSDEYQVRIGHDNHAIIIEIPKPRTYWKQVTIDDLQLRHFIRRGPVATLGLGLQDNPKRINFQEVSMAHVLISGQTRSGKTNSQKLIAWNLAHNTTPLDSKLLILDVAKKGFKWADFSNVAHLLHPLVTEITEADKVLAWLNLEIERRATEHYTTPKVFVLVDELKALTDDSKVATDYLSRIASVGGEFGIHLILATQYPQIKMLGSAELKRNVTTRLCGKVDDSQAAVNALGVADSGAESLGGYGDFLLKDFQGLSRLTVAHLQEKHVIELPRSEVKRLDLPDSDLVNDGPKFTREPEPIEPEQVALALYKPMGINKLASELSIGSTKAKRVKEFADKIRVWAVEHGYAV
ncbi:MAG: hypothetical protein DPW09_00545 [Anaerolineae bacterium]|nr:hypothetical protein [Anaerolineae bacterium]